MDERCICDMPIASWVKKLFADVCGQQDPEKLTDDFALWGAYVTQLQTACDSAVGFEKIHLSHKLCRVGDVVHALENHLATKEAV